MGLFSFFKRKRRTYQASYTSYKSTRFSRKKPFVPKVIPVATDRTSRRRSEKAGRFFAYFKLFLIFFGIGAALYGLFFTSLFEIQNIDVNGEADTLDEQTAVSTYLQEFLGDNLLTFSPMKHEKTLLEQYGYLKTLDIDRNFFHTVRATLETYPPIANVRIEFEDGSTQFYTINELGLVAGTGTTLESLPLIVMDVTGTEMDLSVTTTEVNKELIEQDTLILLLETAKDFEGKFDLQILEIRYLKRARELHLLTERNFAVWIDLTQDLPIQLAKLKKALAELNIYEANLEYIDLRISGQNGEKVIYKLRTESE
ncbi:hypothetical protein A3J23_01165 [Candidatus Peregrinibacteria bacterium RIFCSPLOWO2_02_FULL_48_14]|nr:MAG: hypothetical protein A2974_00880 [Candidatus Peregrinibacteria bacterium RIFCSPLOWO2_01_FULL_48_20]OGJ45466.1 MAG: hypothetical protein A3J23_01165 [Candidatus Peregrinibacteria bacterium RIFCSPLOWO2_02_FULL_48_14]